MTKRFQECNKLEKLWRYRWYLLLPFVWLKIKISVLLNDTDDLNLTNKSVWGLSKGLMQSKMNWFYTMEEVMGEFDKKFVDKKKK